MMASMTLVLATATATVATSRGDQTLTVYAPAAGADRAGAKPHVLVLSGEGGWRSFDDQLSTWLSASGYWVGGIDCLAYFRKPQDDRAALAADVARYADALARASGSAANAPIVLAGYSFGADLAPWIAGAGNHDKRIAAMVLIGPDLKGSLEARVGELLGLSPNSHTFDTEQALADARAIPALFLHGSDDNESAAPALAASFKGKKKLSVVPGATHHFAHHEDELKRALIDGLQQILSLRQPR
jgi:type IV secretory pathway VirJ component